MAKAVCLALHLKKKLGFTDGTIPKLENNLDKKEEWWKMNTLVGSWILNTIEPSLHSSINYSERVDESWANLKERGFWWATVHKI